MKSGLKTPSFVYDRILQLLFVARHYMTPQIISLIKAPLFKMKNGLQCIVLIWGLIYTTELKAIDKMHFVTATDTEHFTWTLNLVAGIHRYHLEQLGEIAIYDLGLNAEQRSYLNTLENVQVYNVERTNPFIFLKFTVDEKGKIARGWYSWKPVVIKQAMDLHPEFFYLDSGVSILGPLDLLFEQVQEKGYFLIDCGHSIERMATQHVIHRFQLNDPSNKRILSKKGISAGFQGLSRAIYQSYVLPAYELAHDIANFEDDGSCPKGFGWSRHDQTIFSILARLLNLQVYEVIRGGNLKLKNDGKTVKLKLDDFIEITRADFDLEQSKPFLRFKRASSNLK